MALVRAVRPAAALRPRWYAAVRQAADNSPAADCPRLGDKDSRAEPGRRWRRGHIREVAHPVAEVHRCRAAAVPAYSLPAGNSPAAAVAAIPRRKRVIARRWQRIGLLRTCARAEARACQSKNGQADNQTQRFPRSDDAGLHVLRNGLGGNKAGALTAPRRRRAVSASESASRWPRVREHPGDGAEDSVLGCCRLKKFS